MADQSTDDNIGKSILDLHLLIEMVGAGIFYDDYDKSTAAYGAAASGLTAISEALQELQAKVVEYEHVLEHVADPHPVPGAPPQTACSECQKMAKAALDGTYRDHYIQAVFEGE